MRKYISFLLAIIFSASTLLADTGWFQDYVKIDVNGAGVSTSVGTGWYWIGTDPGSGTQLQTANFGTINSLSLKGCDMKYWSDTQDRTGGAYYYKIMNSDGTTEIVAPRELIWTQTKLSAANDYQGTKTDDIDLLYYLAPNTTYQLHIWAKHWGSGQGENFLSNNSADYVATFTTGNDVTLRTFNFPTNYCSVATTPNTNNNYGLSQLTIKKNTSQAVFTHAVSSSWNVSESHYEFTDSVKFGVKPGGTITLTVSGFNNTKWSDCFVFFDWNQDGVFNQTNERVQVWEGNTTQINNHSITINVPADARPGEIAMRIRCDEEEHFGGDSNPQFPCYKIYRGSTHTIRMLVIDPTDVNAVQPEVSTATNPKYYLIYSGTDTDAESVNGQTIDAYRKVLYSPDAPGRIAYEYLTNITNQDMALWEIVEDGGIKKLKNKGSGLYLSESHSVATSVSGAFQYSLISGTQYQYQLKNNNTPSWMLAYSDGNLDRWSSELGANSLTSWMFVPQNSLNLNGTNQYMYIPDHDDFDIAANENFTVTMKVKATALVTNARILSKRDQTDNATNYSGYDIFGTHNLTDNLYAINCPTETLYENYFSQWWGTASGQGLGKWMHLAFTVSRDANNDATITMYLNGVAGADGPSTKSAWTVSSASDVFIGYNPLMSGIGYLKGAVDDVRFYSKALTNAEIVADQTATVTTATADLIAAYDFENVDYVNGTVPDIKGTHTGYLVGYSPLTVSDPNHVYNIAGIGNSYDPILRTEITMDNATALPINNVVVNLDGTTHLSDITKLRVYTTGTNPRFDSRNPTAPPHNSSITGATLLGEATPTAGDITIDFSEKNLQPGKNVIWIAAEISPTATEGDKIDIALKSITYNTNKVETINSTKQNPIGNVNIFLKTALLLAPGDYNSTHYRIPALITAADGALLAITDKRKTHLNDLPKDIDVIAQRSTNGGKTWEDPITIAQGTGEKNGFGDAAIAMKSDGKLVCIFAGGPGFWHSTATAPIRIYRSESSDNGVTWSTAENITSQFYGTGCTDPTRATWDAMFVSSGNMLYTKTDNGERLWCVAVVRHGSKDNFVFYSDDDGATWNSSNTTALSGGDEAKIMQLADGTFVISSRREGNEGRLKATSADGMTWNAATHFSDLVEPACNGDFIRFTMQKDGFTQNRLLHSIPNHATIRKNVSVFLSTDEAATWSSKKTIIPGGTGYSSLAVLPDGTIGVYIEVTDYSYAAAEPHEAYEMIFVNFSLDWLTDGADNENVKVNRWKGSTSTDQSNATNWLHGEYGGVPQSNAHLIFDENATNDLSITDDMTVANLTNKSGKALVINPGKQLVVNGKVTTNNDPSQILIKASADGSGAGGTLHFAQPTNNTDVKATVEFYSKAYKYNNTETNKYRWQYFGIPVGAVVADPTFYNAYIRKWNEAGSNGNYWQAVSNTTALTPFDGYEITQDVAGSYQIPGTLNTASFGGNELTVTTGADYSGQYIYANPYTVALDIKNDMVFGDGMVKTVYLFNTGSQSEWAGFSATSSNATAPGEYTAIPQNIAGTSGMLGTVSSMQGFTIEYLPASTTGRTFQVNYPTAADRKNSEPLRVQSQKATQDALYSLVITAQGSDTYADKVWLFTEPTTSNAFDNGWDGAKVLTSGNYTQLYAVQDGANYQVATTHDIDQTALAFKAATGVTDYTMTLENNTGANYPHLALVDNETGTVTKLNAGTNTYNFTSTNTIGSNRFLISNSPNIITALENSGSDRIITITKQVDALLIFNPYLKDGKVAIYDLLGKMIYSNKIISGNNNIKTDNMEEGVYLIKVEVEDNKRTIKLSF